MNKKAKGKSIYKKQDNIAGYVMLAPWMFGFLLMWFIPMLISMLNCNPRFHTRYLG